MNEEEIIMKYISVQEIENKIEKSAAKEKAVLEVSNTVCAMEELSPRKAIRVSETQTETE